jgi:hypothetical protein
LRSIASRRAWAELRQTLENRLSPYLTHFIARVLSIESRELHHQFAADIRG